jgi:proline dehydrogenase
VDDWLVSLWQRSMIALARRETVKAAAERFAGASLLARRFVGGDGPVAAVETARRLRDESGITASLFYLGEYVGDTTAVERNVEMTIAAVERLGAAGLDVHVSIDPTAIGYMAGEELAARNAERIGRAIAAQPADGRSCLMLDMEDLALVEPTLRLHGLLRGQGLPAAVTLQARLRRTESDLASLLVQPTDLRLVKGAFPRGPEHDVQGRQRIRARYVELASRMLSPEAREAGFYPVFATHDDALARELIELARRNGWRPGQYEFELLYGVRPHWQMELRARGEAVRVYLPFGTDWWPYGIRRVGENPRNLILLGRALFARPRKEPHSGRPGDERAVPRPD